MSRLPQKPALDRQSAPAAPAPRARSRRMARARRNLLTAAFSVVGHLLVLLALVLPPTQPPQPPPPEPMIAELVEPPRPPDPVTPPAPTPAPAPPAATPPAPAPARARPSPAKPTPRRALLRPTRTPRDVEPLPASEDTGDALIELSDAQLASAATAGSGSGSGAGSGGGACNMARWLQNALRKDPRVQAVVAEAHRGKALLVWNGDWVRHPGQEGSGLAAVREAVMWEVGFAPPACRAERVRGLVLISLRDGPGGGRLVLGTGDWRWSDLLFPRRTASVDGPSRR